MVQVLAWLYCVDSHLATRLRREENLTEKTAKIVAETGTRTLVHITTVPASLFGFISGQPRYMSAHGFKVHVISSPEDLLGEFAMQEGITAHGIAMTRRITPFADLVVLARLRAVLRRIRPQVVHAHSPKGGLLGMLAAWMNRVPVRIYTIHGFRFLTERGLKRSILVAAERISCRLAHEVFCVSESVRHIAVEHRICSQSKIRVLLKGSCNGVDAERQFNPERFTDQPRSGARSALGIPEDALVAGFVGRIVRDKGIEELAAAWSKIKAEFSKARLLIIGKFEDEDPVPQDIVGMLIDDASVHVMGFQPPERLPELFNAMDVFVLPSHREGFPVVLLEAGAMGLPVVATDIPGCVDAVVEGETGTLVPEYDAGALAAAIARYLRDSALRAAHGAAARARVLRDYRQVDMWNAIIGEYERLLTNNAK